jgi:pyoverdine/dityrosine biosynthesis protein Dit1
LNYTPETLLEVISVGNSMDSIIKEKISADHLLYVSLKYTKTCDVIINLLLRWKIMIEMSMDKLIEVAKKKKKWKPVPDAPRAKLLQLKKIYANVPEVAETLELYELFRDIEKLEKVRENEFRKGVNLRVSYKGETIEINLDKLKEYSEVLERFISYLK